MKTIKNPTAFPLKHSDDKYNPGMTLRDYFAGQIASEYVRQGKRDESIAQYSYEVAEQLLIARQQYEPKNNG